MNPHTLQRPPDPGEAQKDEGLGVGAEAFRAQRERDESRQYAGAATVIPVRAGATQLSKAEADVIAPAALAGVAVTPTEDDRGRRVYVVSRWAMARQCDTLDEVRQLLLQMGVTT